jgi:hypothetical protein
MNEIHAAVIQLRQAGKTDEEIISEFIASGYTRAEAIGYLHETEQEPAVIAAASEPAIQFHEQHDHEQHDYTQYTDHVDHTDTTTPDAVAHSDAAPAATVTSVRPSALKWIVLGIVALLLLGAVGAWLVLRDAGVSSFAGLVGVAPYDDEAALLLGVLGDYEMPEFYSVAFSTAITFSSSTTATTYTNADIDEGFDEMNGIGIQMPQYGQAQFGYTATIDQRQALAVLATAAFAINMEPIVVDGAASLVMADDTAYLRLDDTPPLFDALSDWLPKQTWIEAGPVPISELEQQLQDVVEEIAGDYATSTLAFVDLVRAEVFGETDQDTTQDLAFGPVTSLEDIRQYLLAAVGDVHTADLRVPSELQVQINELLEEYPFITFVGKPTYEQSDNQSYFKYEYDLAYEELVAFIDGVIAIASDGQYDPATDGSSGQFITPDVIAEINAATELYVLVNRLGLMAGHQIHSYIKPTRATGVLHLSLEQEFYTPRIDAVVTPSDVHPQTLEELIKAFTANQSSGLRLDNIPTVPDPFGLNNARQDAQDATDMMILNNARMTAELYYNENAFSYSGFCTNRGDQNSVVNVLPPQSLSKANCYDTATQYAVTLQLSDGTYECIDSVGESRTNFSALREGQTRCDLMAWLGESDAPSAGSGRSGARR